MFERSRLLLCRVLRESSLRLQEVGPADEEVANRLQRDAEELEEIEQLAMRARSKVAESMRAARGLLRELGIAPPPMSRPPTAAAGARPQPEHGLIAYAPTKAGACLGCGESVGSGPIGWLAEPEPGPVCDECLKQRCGQLAIGLELMNFFRELGEVECDSGAEEDQAESLLTGMGGQTEALFLRGCAPPMSLPVERLYELLEEIEERNERMGAPGAAGGRGLDGATPKYLRVLLGGETPSGSEVDG